MKRLFHFIALTFLLVLPLRAAYADYIDDPTQPTSDERFEQEEQESEIDGAFVLGIVGTSLSLLSLFIVLGIHKSYKEKFNLLEERQKEIDDLVRIKPRVIGLLQKMEKGFQPKEVLKVSGSKEGGRKSFEQVTPDTPVTQEDL